MKHQFATRTIVTGGAGFIGSNYLNYAVPRYPDELFINIDALTYAGDLKNVTVDTAPNYAFEKVDICDDGLLSILFEKYAPTGIIHFAAESHVDQSIENPSVFARTNLMGTNNLAYLARDAKVERFHFISTDEVYGELATGDAPFTEQSPYAPRNPYSASKAGAELLLASYLHTYGMPLVTTRSSNTYGPGQDRTKLIPKFVTNLLAGKKVPLYASGEHIRNWLYVGDAIEGIDAVFRKGKVGETYNIGGPEELTNRQVTDALLALMNKTADDIEFVPDRLGHDFRYALSSEKIARELGWKAKTSFTEGIQKTVAFYTQ